jgi:hypothetical protein
MPSEVANAVNSLKVQLITEIKKAKPIEWIILFVVIATLLTNIYVVFIRN